jgi:hypothetical protein
MIMKLASTVGILGAIVGAGCKKKEDASPASTASAVSEPGAAKPAVAAKPAGACAAGFTDLGDVGACVKLPAGLKPDPTDKPPGGSKGAVFAGEGHTRLTITTQSYNEMFWDDHIKGLLSGGGFGGKLLEQGKIGDGVWGVFDVDDGRSKVSASHSHGKTTTVECLAWHDVGTQEKPAIEEMMEVCKTVVAQ